MENRLRIFLLMLSATMLGGCSHLWPWHHRDKAPDAAAKTAEADAIERADASDEPPTVIEPVVERRKIKVPKINSEDVEFGADYGEVSIEDFTAVPVTRVSLAYHISEDFFFEAAAGKATGGKTSFETLGGNVQLLSNAERQFTFYNLSVGYNFLPGEVFIGRNLAMGSSLYLLGGVGSTKFAGDQHFTINFGAGFRVLPTDWLAIHIGVQDLVFKSDLLGVDRLKNNLTAHIGATFFF